MDNIKKEENRKMQEMNFDGYFIILNWIFIILLNYWIWIKVWTFFIITFRSQKMEIEIFISNFNEKWKWKFIPNFRQNIVGVGILSCVNTWFTIEHCDDFISKIEITIRGNYFRCVKATKKKPDRIMIRVKKNCYVFILHF